MKSNENSLYRPSLKLIAASVKCNYNRNCELCESFVKDKLYRRDGLDLCKKCSDDVDRWNNEEILCPRCRQNMITNGGFRFFLCLNICANCAEQLDENISIRKEMTVAANNLRRQGISWKMINSNYELLELECLILKIKREIKNKKLKL